MIHNYIPFSILPKKVQEGNYEDVSLEEFYELLARADFMRDIAISDIHTGFLKAMNDVLGDK